MNLEYNVNSFDTLDSIAQKFGVSTQELKKCNNITSGLPQRVFIPVKQQQNFSVVANFKREYLHFGNGEQVKVALAKHDLFCANINSNINLFKPKNNNIYVVGVLDNLTSVCNKFNLDKQEIVKLNNLTTDKLFIGQILKLK